MASVAAMAIASGTAPASSEVDMHGAASMPDDGDATLKEPEVYPSPFELNDDWGSGDRPRTRAEKAMMALSAAIRSKDGWREKMMDAGIVSKWKTEAAAQGIAEPMIEYVMDELTWYAAQLRDGIEPSVVDGVYQADGIVPPALQAALGAGVARLEAQPPDWHPGSNEQVLDLVHPSLYPYMMGVSRELPEDTGASWDAVMGTGTVVSTNPAAAASNNGRARFVVQRQCVSQKFQWLPAEFDVSASGDVNIASYINNLHPGDFADTYSALAGIFKHAIPLLERVLTDMRCPRAHRLDESTGWYKGNEGGEDDGDADDDEQWQDHFGRPRTPVVPAFEPPATAPARRTTSLRGRRLQVIVKLAEIVLTPEKPTYTEGTWHVEGMQNEHIVATAIYYFSSDNISASLLEFRRSVCEPDYEQGDDVGVWTMYGLQSEEPLVEHLGAAETKEDRVLAFPNTWQHRVQPFRLIDPTKPGVRKILVFFLVDPTKRIISTARVPPQQRSWLVRHLQQVRSAQLGIPLSTSDVDASLPPEWPLTLEAAFAVRKELMRERKFYVAASNAEVFARPFSLCEH